MAACFLDGLFVEQIMSAGFVFGVFFVLYCFGLVFFSPSYWDSVTAAAGVGLMEVEQSSCRYLFISKCR